MLFAHWKPFQMQDLKILYKFLSWRRHFTLPTSSYVCENLQVLDGFDPFDIFEAYERVQNVYSRLPTNFRQSWEVLEEDRNNTAQPTSGKDVEHAKNSLQKKLTYTFVAGPPPHIALVKLNGNKGNRNIACDLMPIWYFGTPWILNYSRNWIP